MSKIRVFFCSTVGKKVVVGITGIGISLFVLFHMLENSLLLLLGAEVFNKYSHTLVSNPLIYIPEVGLVLFFLLHVGFAAKLTLENRCARQGSYAVKPSTKGASFASRTMILTGALVFVFLVLHIWHFKYGLYYEVEYGGVPIRDLHRLVIERFQEPLFVAWYIFSLLVLGLHLSHGVSGLFQSLGIGSSLNSDLRRLAWTFAIVVAGGFISQPLIIFFGGLR